MLARAEKATRQAAEGKPLRSRYAVTPDKNLTRPVERVNTLGVALFSCFVFVLVFAVVLAIWRLATDVVTLPGIAVAVVVALLFAMSMHIAQEWERVLVLRFGAFNRISGPGLYFTIPFVEQNAARIDLRTRVTTFDAEETLTSDLVPLNVDAALFWMVFDPKACCLEVESFDVAVELAAQTALREAIGRLSAAQVAIKREQLDREIKEDLAAQVESWGISILNVEVRDILLPKELQDAMSFEAQAEQRRKGRLILAEAERDMAEMLVDAAKSFEGIEDALRLRNMHMIYESVKESGGTVVLPSSFAEGLGDVLPESMKQ